MSAHMAMRKTPGRKPDNHFSWLSGITHREFKNPVRALLRTCLHKITKARKRK